jgi:hypothetical protein
LHDGGVGSIQAGGELRAAFAGEEAAEDGNEIAPIMRGAKSDMGSKGLQI